MDKPRRRRLVREPRTFPPPSETGPGTFTRPYTVDELEALVPAELAEANQAANAANRRVGNRIDNCIAVGCALCRYLLEYGHPAELVRISAGVFPPNSVQAVVLGSEGHGTRRPAAGPGMWRGHLGVECEGFLLDPTLDQATGPEMPYPVPPMVVLLPADWGKDRWASVYIILDGGTRLRWTRYPRQVGFRSVPAARPAQWRDIYEAMQQI
jgi:hypothetical protein